MMPADDLSAALAEKRAALRTLTSGTFCLTSSAAVGRLGRVAGIAGEALAAVDAALSFHVPENMKFDNPRVPPFRYCKRCPGHPKWPCPPVTAIRAALTGKGESSG